MSKLLFFLLLNISIISSIRLKDNDFFTSEMRNLVHKIYRLSKSKNNIVLMNLLKERLRKLIMNREIDRPEVSKDKYKNIQERKVNFTTTDTGTYNLITYEKMEFDRGYQASFETNFDSYSDKDYEILTYKLSLMTDNNVYLGVWEGSEEFSFYFDDLELATVVCILYNQISLYDWAREEDINNPYFEELS